MFNEKPLTSRLFGNDQPSFGGQSMNVLPVVAVDGATGSPLGIHRSSSARPSLPWEQAPSLRDRLVATITNDDQSGGPLLLRLDALEKEIHAHLRSKQQEQELDVKAELAQIGARGRAAVERVQATAEALAQARQQYNANLEQVAAARAALAEVKATEPLYDDFPTDEEVAAYNVALGRAKARYDKAHAASSNLNAAMRQAKAAHAKAERELVAVRARRNELEALLEGKRTSAIAGIGPIGLQGE